MLGMTYIMHSMFKRIVQTYISLTLYLAKSERKIPGLNINDKTMSTHFYI